VRHRRKMGLSNSEQELEKVALGCTSSPKWEGVEGK
jgi:hypothetical protein